MLVVGGTLAIWKWNTQPSSSGAAKPGSFAVTYPGLDLKDPIPSFECLRYVAETGGDEITRQVAIIWLDQEVRRGLPFSPEREAWLLNLLENNGHTTWDAEYRLWIFNSAFNVLQSGRDQEKFTQLLHQLARHDTDRTMRLYALQHIGAQRTAGRLNGALAKEIYAALQDLVSETNGEVAGTAISLLAEWNGQDQSTDPDIFTKAVEIAADNTRSVDVRVTALHVAKAHALPLSRQLAIDFAQPVLLRKAAIASIGLHGEEIDLSDLEKLSGENSRIAQAAQPALRSIRHRIANPNAPALVPF